MKNKSYYEQNVPGGSRIFINHAGDPSNMVYVVEFYSSRLKGLSAEYCCNEKTRIASIIRRADGGAVYTIGFKDKSRIIFVTNLSKSAFIGAMMNNDYLSDFREWCLFNVV